MRVGTVGTVGFSRLLGVGDGHAPLGTLTTNCSEFVGRDRGLT